MSLSFLRHFYDSHIRVLDERTPESPRTTDWVAKNVVMRETWAGAGDGRARRFAELLEPAQLWCV